MASVTESLFGSLFQAPGQGQAQAVQQAYQPVSDGMGMFLGQIRGTGEELRQGIGRTFGQEPVADQQKRKLQAIVQSTQQQVDVGTPEGLAKLAENLNQFPEFGGIALALRQQAAQTAQEGQLKQAQIGKYEAEAEKAMRTPEEKPSNAAKQMNELISLGVPKDVAMKTAYKLPDAEQAGQGVNNNGVTVGTFDKVGRYKSADGRIYSNKAYTDALNGHDAANDLLYKLSELTKEDIVNAYGSATDYTTKPGGGLYSRTLGNPKTYDAQVKINEIGIRNVLNNLQQLKGPSSDKEMAQMIKDFPGFDADPKVMENWVKRAVKATNRFLKRNEQRYGFDTDYLVPSWLSKEPATPKPNEVPSASKAQSNKAPLGTMQNPIKLD